MSERELLTEILVETLEVLGGSTAGANAPPQLTVKDKKRIMVATEVAQSMSRQTIPMADKYIIAKFCGHASKLRMDRKNTNAT